LTRPLYDEDPFLREFEAVVTEVRVADALTRVTLDRTAFYPGGGGQPGDCGTLGTARVVSMEERDGVPWHVLDGPVPDGARLRGAIDWARRFDHMQQHTGQHILSQAFIGAAGAETRSFHMGEAVVTIDIEHAGPDDSLLACVEDRANEIVWEDHPVLTHVVTGDQVSRYPLRRAPTVDGPIRVVEVEGFDWSACGGTHVRSSGQIGAITILGAERYKGGTRIEFICGGRALRRHRDRGRMLRGLALEFTAGEMDLPSAVARLREDRDRLARRLKPLLKEALDREAEALVSGAEHGARGPVVALHFPDRDAAEVGALSALIAARGAVALLFAGGEPSRAHFSAPAGTIGVGEILGAVCRRHGGKGGGRPESAQGAVPREQVAGAVATARELALAGPGEGTSA
jgi:alanyl-tRNA synthetase